MSLDKDDEIEFERKKNTNWLTKVKSYQLVWAVTNVSFLVDDVDKKTFATFKEAELTSRKITYDKDVNWEEIFSEFKEGIQSEQQMLQCSLQLNRTERRHIAQNLSQGKENKVSYSKTIKEINNFGKN